MRKTQEDTFRPQNDFHTAFMVLDIYQHWIGTATETHRYAFNSCIYSAGRANRVCASEVALIDLWGFTSQNELWLRAIRSGGIGNFDHLGFFSMHDVAQYMGLNLSLPSKCSHRGRDSILRPSDRQPSAITTGTPWQDIRTGMTNRNLWISYVVRCSVMHQVSYAWLSVTTKI